MENPHRRFFWQLRRWKEKLFVDLAAGQQGLDSACPAKK
jgi:hypothetical protein